MLLFDGACGFCTAVARWAEHRLPRGSRVVPWQRAHLDRLGLTPEDAARVVWWIDPDGAPYAGHLAVAEALRAIGGAWGALGTTIRVPPIRWVAGGVYVLVARARGHLPGTTPAIRDR